MLKPQDTTNNHNNQNHNNNNHQQAIEHQRHGPAEELVKLGDEQLVSPAQVIPHRHPEGEVVVVEGALDVGDHVLLIHRQALLGLELGGTVGALVGHSLRVLSPHVVGEELPLWE